VHTTDPLGRPVGAEILLAGTVAYIESSQACRLHLLDADERDPLRATSFGLGLVDLGCHRSRRPSGGGGPGGSATNDCWAGMLAALGAPPVDAAGYALPPGGGSLIACVALGDLPRLRADVSLVAASEVNNPLTGPAGRQLRVWVAERGQ
jgi:glycerate kinase